MKARSLFIAIVFIAVAEAVGIIGFLLGGDFISWYMMLSKPSVSPPTWVFGPVWTLLYALMGIAAFLVWRSRPAHSVAAKRRSRALRLYAAQLFANFIWTPLFFGMHNVGLALIDIVVLWCLIVATMVSFYSVNRTAAYLLIPYLCWVSFATFLNASIWFLNI